MVMLLTFIRLVPILNLERDTDYYSWVIRGFPKWQKEIPR
jgi:hypothetical protein